MMHILLGSTAWLYAPVLGSSAWLSNDCAMISPHCFRGSRLYKVSLDSATLLTAQHAKQFDDSYALTVRLAVP